MTRRRVLHITAQRPDSTGSGVTLDALVRHAAAAGWEQRVVCGIAAGDRRPVVGGLSSEQTVPLEFGGGELAFLLPGMSDVMPYPSTRFSEMSREQITAYRRAWAAHLERVLTQFAPDVIHCHHVWLVSALLKDVAPGVPVVTHCHATGLRQMGGCQRLASEVVAGCARNDRFVVLMDGHAVALCQRLGVERSRVRVVGAGFRDDLFFRGEPGDQDAIAYVGKLARAKGVPWLLDAFDRLAASRPGVTLQVAGAGGGVEAENLAARMRRHPRILLHGQLPQERLGDLLRSCAVLVLPSFYEGLPLVLVEALACGCRPVCTRLPGVVEEIVPRLGGAFELVDVPRLRGADEPVAEDLPAFVDRLVAALLSALARGPARGVDVSAFTWGAVFRRVEAVWNELVT